MLLFMMLCIYTTNILLEKTTMHVILKERPIPKELEKEDAFFNNKYF